jgi:KDO2-lipid IV(A) lauroyltransferase
MGERFERMGLAVLRNVSRLPYPVLRGLGNLSGSIAWWLAAPRRRVALTNLRLCFPDWTEAQRRQVARDHFRLFMRSFFERFVFWYGSPERIRSLGRIEGIEHFEAHHGRPMILLAPHFVGIDAGGTRLQVETPVASMYAAQKSRVLTEAMTQGRSRFHTGQSTMILRTEGMRAALRPIREGVPFYFLPDMDLGSRDAVFVPFFGVPAATVTSVSRLARITRAAVVPCVTRLTHDGYVVTMYPAWEGFPSGDLEADTRRMNAFIEERVREMPAQYLWTHKRFKTRPPGEAGFYGKRHGHGDEA